VGKRGLLAEKEMGKGKFQIVTPSLSILAEPAVAVVTENAKKHGTQEAADAYLRYLYTPEAQTAIAHAFYRPRDAKWPNSSGRSSRDPDGHHRQGLRWMGCRAEAVLRRWRRFRPHHGQEVSLLSFRNRAGHCRCPEPFPARKAGASLPSCQASA
jgi:hypothetical protein